MRVRTKLPGFCKSKTVVRVGARSSSQPYKKNGLIKFDKTDNKNNIEMSFNSVDSRQDFESTGNNNRVMVVVDPSLDANCALQWALSHTVQSQDTIILLYVSKISNEGSKLLF